jgi:zinc protease
MIKFNNFLSTLFIGGLVLASCRPSVKTTTNKPADNKTVENTTTVINTDAKPTDLVIADTSEPKTRPIKGISGGNKGGAVKEQASGMDEVLPLNPSVRTGVLDNGMRYYIQQNSKPEKRVELRLAVNAGAMQEDDDQRGLAHFVEHMAFNGTTNFQKNDLISFLENTGVNFGADLNAYTSFDETVYMLQMPTDKAGLVDKALLVMQDWATGITFENTEIDKERGVIESEWRTGLGATERLREKYWNKLFYQSRYADRLPIGTMEIIRNAPYNRFKEFYKDWYRPNLMALVVVGDINVDEIEKKIKADFSKLKNPANPREKKVYDVPMHKETFVAIATDKEASSMDIELIYKHKPQPTQTLADYRRSLMVQLYSSMLSARFSELAQQKTASFTRASGGYGNFVRSIDAYFASASAKETGVLASLEMLITEHARVLQHGFNESELERQKLAIKKQAEKKYNERDKTTSGNISMEYVSHFLENQPAMNTEKEYQLVKEFLAGIKLEEINLLAKTWLTDENRSVIITAPEKATVKVPTETEVRAVLEKLQNVKTEPYKDKFLDMPLIAKEPTAGQIKTTKIITDNNVDVTEYLLSNGVKVIVKPTKFKNDEILMQAFSPGGHSLYSDKDYYAAAYAASIIDESGVGAFDMIGLEKKLTGLNVGASPYIDELYEGFKGNASVEDFTTMLQLTYLYATAPRKDKDAFELFISNSKEEVRNLTSNPQFYFYDEMYKAQTSNHPRRKIAPSEKDLDGISLDRSFQIYQERFSDFSDFTFVFVGNVDMKIAPALFEKYLGSLPSKNRIEAGKDVMVKTPTGSVNNFKKGIAPQSNVVISFHTDESWSREKDYKLDAMSRVLETMVRENLREDKGGVYSPYIDGSFEVEPKGKSQVMVMFQCAPDNVDNLVQAVKDEIKKLQTEGATEDDFNKIREQQRRANEVNMESNRYWTAAITGRYRRKEELKNITEYNKLIDALKKEDIKTAANQFMDLKKAVIVTVNPEKVSTEKP